MQSDKMVLNRKQIEVLAQELLEAAELFGRTVSDDASRGMQQIKIAHLNSDGSVGWTESKYTPQEARALNAMFQEALGQLGEKITPLRMMNSQQYGDCIWDSWQAAEAIHLSLPNQTDLAIPLEHKMQMYQKFKGCADSMMERVTSANQSRSLG